MKISGLVFLLLGIILIVSSSVNLAQLEYVSENRDLYRSLTSHAPIFIQDDSQFDPAHGVTGGSGTQSDPYVIENYTIDGNGTAAIYIFNTTKYLLIRSCEVYNGSSGIRIEKAKNVIVENVSAHDNTYGVFVYNATYDVTITDSLLENNRNGVYIRAPSDTSPEIYNITVDCNRIFNSGDFGVMIEGYSVVHNVSITNNVIATSGSYGLYIYWTDHDIISGNSIRGSAKYGIYIYYRVSNVLITDNTVSSSGGYGIYISNYCGNSWIYNNSFYYNNGATDTYDPAHVQGYEGYYSHNYWNTSGTPHGYGNFWNDWANNNNSNDQSPQDGIVDWPYVLDGDTGAKDYYPLKNSTPIPELSSLLVLMFSVLFVGVILRRRKH